MAGPALREVPTRFLRGMAMGSADNVPGHEIEELQAS